DHTNRLPRQDAHPNSSSSPSPSVCAHRLQNCDSASGDQPTSAARRDSGNAVGASHHASASRTTFRRASLRVLAE
ncbi:MAG: hypothetical protein ACTS27_12690, partial [Phycisphaerales bacterium]